jgi:hypothetical protein
MKPQFDDLISTLVAVLHYKFDRYDPDWPDVYSMLVTDSMLRAFEILGLAVRGKDEGGQTIWRATSELRGLATNLGDIEETSGSGKNEYGAGA